ncbi:type IV pilin [Halorubrum lacusprofundi]|jgi:flagellin-like protein|uniref:Archaeal Type IV pilin N-terminal domain-containing protein n=1 Tax=Halorubrum lacusprofundi TaxID=2247 RepID=A0A220SWW7_9EURY|nr:type IV pilin N-terminal domain-containing protein [Halorubrum lacusprofundi]ASK38189.1 hypothetical protein [Halorubrum lacusprofundi]
MNLKTAFQDNDRAVSPVIGVILMVAITVILAAVVGTFVLGLGDQIGGSATAGVTVDGDNTTDVTVTLTNLGTAESVKIVDSNGTSINTTGVTGNLPMNSTGASVTLDDTTTLGGNSYNIVAVGPGGEQSVLRSFQVASP